MNTFRRACVALTLTCAALSSCEIFEEQTPETVSFRMTGTAGDSVTVIYSKQFVSATNETGVTQVQLFGADTVRHVLPIDTIIDVRLERQLFISARPQILGDTVNVSVDVTVNQRSVFDGTGNLLPDDPWLFLYRFNAPPTQAVEIVI
jgi:hypothetical protein